MEKKKQSKKRWAWTEAQRRKQWSRYGRYYGGVPRWFCRILDNHDKRNCQMALRELKHGADPEDFIFNPKYNNSSAKWLWW